MLDGFGAAGLGGVGTFSTEVGAAAATVVSLRTEAAACVEEVPGSFAGSRDDGLWFTAPPSVLGFFLGSCSSVAFGRSRASGDEAVGGCFGMSTGGVAAAGAGASSPTAVSPRAAVEGAAGAGAVELDAPVAPTPSCSSDGSR